jgi:hypothetical protein
MPGPVAYAHRQRCAALRAKTEQPGSLREIHYEQPGSLREIHYEQPGSLREILKTKKACGFETAGL